MIIIGEKEKLRLIEILYAYAAACESSCRLISHEEFNREQDEIYQLSAYLALGGEQWREEQNDD